MHFYHGKRVGIAPGHFEQADRSQTDRTDGHFDQTDIHLCLDFQKRTLRHHRDFLQRPDLKDPKKAKNKIHKVGPYRKCAFLYFPTLLSVFPGMSAQKTGTRFSRRWKTARRYTPFSK